MKLVRAFALLLLAVLSAGVLAADAPARVRHFTFDAFGEKEALRLRADETAAPLYIGLRADETVTKAVLKLKYMFSPLLIPSQSHIRVLLNEELIDTLPMTREATGSSVVRTLELDPATLRRYNRLTLELVGNYFSCQVDQHPNLWADIAKGSEVEVAVRHTGVESDLALLPEPFFDRADVTRLRVPFVFAQQPSHATLKAAGIVSSWFGMQAGWRDPRFPAHLDTLPNGHAVVFATNAERPQFLAALPPFSGPSLRLLDNPADPQSKLLLIAGRDGSDLALAANALALGTAALSGTQVEVKPVAAAAPRKAYDAPNWVRIDRPMKFGELVESPQQLQVYGHVPPPVRINLRIPPDLFTWRSRGVPVDLKLRYTPPTRSGASQVAMRVNGEQVQTMHLSTSGKGGESTRVVLPLLDTGLLGDSRELLIPAFKLGTRNQLEYQFSLTRVETNDCTDLQPSNMRAMIDADSKIDFSGHPHFAEMPHLGYFATSGFPFTRYADLSQTVAVLPEPANAREIETLLALLARMGESTGYPATHLQVAGEDAEQAFANHDLLLIGSGKRQPLLQRWQKRLPVRLADVKQAALFGFESPLTAKRSVVAVSAPAADELEQVLNLLEDDKRVHTLHGGAVLLREGHAESIAARAGYTIGKLPFWTAIWFPLSTHPVLLAMLAVLAVLILAFALWRTLKAAAARRLE